MKPCSMTLAAIALFAATGLAAKQDKTLVCHVGSETGAAGEVYLDDPNCVPAEENGYHCPDAGKIDLIVIANATTHLDNPGHGWDGITDYAPAAIGASGDGTEDSDGNGVDDGCEPPLPCPCWSEVALLSVTAANHLAASSCSASSLLPLLAVIQNDENAPEVEGGFSAFAGAADNSFCSTRDFEPFFLAVTPESASACIAQIASRCADIGDPLNVP